jgi:hypothetical protein
MHSHYTNCAAQAQSNPLSIAPDRDAICAYLYALFAPSFVHSYPDSWVEIAYARPGHPLSKARIFAAHDLEPVIGFVVKANAAGFNVYVGATLRHGHHPMFGRANKAHFCAARYSWIEYDEAGDHERVISICKAQHLAPALMVVTGTIPHQRCHLYFLNAEPISTPDELQATNKALKHLFGSDDVDDPARVLRVGGTINYPSPHKVAKGYTTELTRPHLNRQARAYSVDAIRALQPASETGCCPFLDFNRAHRLGGKTDDELLALLEASKTPHCWHNNMRSAVASMVGKGWPEQAVMLACAPYSNGGIHDDDVQKLYHSAVAKFAKEPESNS